MKKLRLIALFSALLVGLGVYQFLKELGKPQETPRTPVVVAVQDIPENTLITPSMVTLIPVASEAVLPNHLESTDSVIGLVMSSDVYTGEQILSNRLVPIGESSSDSSTLSYIVTPGMRAISINVTSVTGVSYLLKPGNHVDLIANYVDQVEIENESDDQDSEKELLSIPTAQFIAQDIEVLAVDRILNKNGLEEYSTVTLLVTPEDALKIDFSEYAGSIRLILRSALDNEIITFERMNLDAFNGRE